MPENNGFIKLESEKYNQFLKVLKPIKEFCKDLDLRGGMLRQRSDDKFTIFDFDLSDIVGNSNISIYEFKDKYQLLKLFSKNDVDISWDEFNITFSNSVSSLKFRIPELMRFNNQFISTNMESLTKIEDNNLLVSFNITKEISEKIKIIMNSKIFKNSNEIDMSFNNGLAEIYTRTINTQQRATFLDNIECVNNMNIKTDITKVPLIMDYDEDLKVEIYDIGNKICFSKFTGTICEVPVKLYTKAYMREE